jgi:hypothetical protein
MPVSPGPEASMGPAEIVKLALQMSIMLTVFGFGLRARSRMRSTSSVIRGCW